MYCSYLCTSCIFIVYLFLSPTSSSLLPYAWFKRALMKNNNNICCSYLASRSTCHVPALTLGLTSTPRLYWGIISRAVGKPRAVGPQCCLHYSWFTFPWWPFEPRPGVAVGRPAPRATCMDSVRLLWQEQSAVYRPAPEAWRPQRFTSCLQLNSNILFILEAASSSLSLSCTELPMCGFSSAVLLTLSKQTWKKLRK